MPLTHRSSRRLSRTDRSVIGLSLGTAAYVSVALAAGRILAASIQTAAVERQLRFNLTCSSSLYERGHALRVHGACVTQSPDGSASTSRHSPRQKWQRFPGAYVNPVSRHANQGRETLRSAAPAQQADATSAKRPQQRLHRILDDVLLPTGRDV